MYLPKTDVYNKLKELITETNNLKVYQSQPEVFKSLPCLTFTVTSNSVETDLNNEIVKQDITVQIDIWGATSSECSDLLNKVESKMRSDFYKLTYSADVPNTDTRVRHVVTRFTTIKL